MRRSKPLMTPVSISAVNVDIVEDYKYLGLVIDIKLDFTIFWGSWGPSTSAWWCKWFFFKIQKASHVVGEELDSLRVLTERNMLSKLRMILDSPSPHLHNMLGNLRRTFSNRLSPPLCYTENPSYLKPSDFTTPRRTECLRNNSVTSGDVLFIIR